MTCDTIGVGYDRNTLTESQRKAKINELVDACMDIFDGNEIGIVLEAIDELNKAVQSMKPKDGVSFTVKTDRCTATVTIENFSERHIEEFNRMLAEQVIRKAETDGLKIA